MPQPELVEQEEPQDRSVFVTAAQWQGPLPPPNVVKAFDNVVENGAERIFRMAEKEQEHRHRMEGLQADAEFNAQSRGQWLGFAVSFASISGAVVAAIMHAPVAVSVALVGIQMAGVVKAFLKTKDTDNHPVPPAKSPSTKKRRGGSGR